MKANCWFGKEDMRVVDVPDPKVLNRSDAIVEVTSTAICGSDIHIYDGFIPTMKKGDIVGHEFMGNVIETGPGVKNLKIGERVILPFPIACGQCFSCRSTLTSLCENSNPNAWIAEEMWGHSTGALFGYSHMTGGYAGGQAEYVRVPYADFNAFKVPDELPDEKVLFLTDILPTGYMAAEACDIKKGNTVAVWGCGPVGQFAIMSAYLLGAERVFAIDRIPERLRMAQEKAGAEVVNYEETHVYDWLMEETGGRGPDACIDAVGSEAHTPGLIGIYDRIKQAMMSQTDRPEVLREAIIACRNGGIVSVPGVYGGMVDKIPLGSLMNRSITVKTGQTHVHRYLRPLLDRIEKSEIDPSFVITHRMALTAAPEAYKIFRDKQDQCIKVVLKP
ncbi:MAG: glutathione-dependent formaldehyde dehydrogenase [Deltaproteobacteria bacterium]|nr:glutathione-dependent formaldehyde dehydrogenase [Deltaproteobacteria bacterium]